ncbi:dTDP-4-amino-4,6-dideoxyglucose formyltransferase [Schleiferia thermophila]|uniref:Formyl transferase-like protein n=1 Tax=Schleiferia thermophila TaxID=884107 RepID=A0A369ABL0_9FLAO|nr:dTDP-4-amino-4,6-dideoxyglucose formyltransferase [Schleiferia thermophila]RCX05686.1 formyl transferase-like protein [Schleiferia thermophila]GCD78825.1 hypothetical protein JCM30197_00720 [Schleiferia thermophila]
MKKKALIITDNFKICSKINQINQILGIDSEFSFATSIYSSIKDFNLSDRYLKQYNLKKDNDVEEIINNYEMVFSIHSKQIFPKILIDSCKCYNLHPGYIPINRGWYPQVFAIINNTPVGATFHEIDENLDLGRIIDREFVKKESWDTSFTLYNKIVNKELELWERNILNVLKGDYMTIEPENNGSIYFKKDFYNLLKLDLNEKVTVKQFIDRLRALTFDSYDNLFFIDENGQKVYVSINLKKGE